MSSNSNAEYENNIKSTIQDTQILIRNQMQNHKKTSKQLHSQIQKDSKTLELLKDKIAKLMLKKEELENWQKIKGNEAPTTTKDIRQKINDELREKGEYDVKIREIQEDCWTVKNELGGLNATQNVQEKYEKHIRILENRLDKANQKFNESIDYDKKLRAEIDKLRKERFFFENIYKKLEKEWEKVRKDISKNLEDAYNNYNQRDTNQEKFESWKAGMVKKEAEYANKLSEIANQLNLNVTRQKTNVRKENKNNKSDELNSNAREKWNQVKNEQFNIDQDNLIEKWENLQYKFEKLEEFTDQKDVGKFCETFKQNAQKNFELFLTISNISNEAKKLEAEIKDIEIEINFLKKDKSSQVSIERNNLIVELKAKTQKILQKQDEYENKYKKYNEDFRQVKTYILEIFNTLNCYEDWNDEEAMDINQGINEGNVIRILSKIEKRMKQNEKIWRDEGNFNMNEQENMNAVKESKGMTTIQINENMKKAFLDMDINKIDSMEKIKNDHRSEEFKFENLKGYSLKVANELMDKVNNPEKKGNKDKKGHH